MAAGSTKALTDMVYHPLGRRARLVDTQMFRIDVSDGSGETEEEPHLSFNP